MHIYTRPNIERVLELLSSGGLPSSDIEDSHLEMFLGYGKEDHLDGIIGLEIYGQYGLLRSLAVAPTARKSGCGRKLVYKIEAVAKSKELEPLYVLTNTEETFFTRLGYAAIDRALVPTPIKNSSEFSSLYPDNATVMVKSLRT